MTAVEQQAKRLKHSQDTFLEHQRRSKDLMKQIDAKVVESIAKRHKITDKREMIHQANAERALRAAYHLLDAQTNNNHPDHEKDDGVET